MQTPLKSSESCFRKSRDVSYYVKHLCYVMYDKSAPNKMFPKVYVIVISTFSSVLWFQ